jgi:acyl-CoA synthetase (AMP-forming)/AMP-acid ligase II
MVSIPHSSDETILDRLRAHAESHPDKLAYRFLRDCGGSDTLTFGQLHRRVRGLAARLSKHASPGDRALLLYPPGLEFIEAFLACLAAGIIAVPAYPPRRNRKAERLQAIVVDSCPRLILTIQQMCPVVEESELGALQAANVIATDAVMAMEKAEDVLEKAPAENSKRFLAAPGDIAFLQYTSGSTRTPCGVIITHANIVENERQIEGSFQHTQQSVMVSWLPVFHDMGLIGGVLQPLYVGFPSVLLSPTSFLREPVRWLRAISEYQGTTTGAPNFAYDHCVRLVSEEQKDGLDLSSLTIAYNGAEPVRDKTLDSFAAAFARCNFRREAFFPCYGLAEATLFVAGGPPNRTPTVVSLDAGSLERDLASHSPVGADGSRCLVSSGKAAYDVILRVVNPKNNCECEDGNVGEIWLSSPSVAGGYWGNSGDSKQVFQAEMCADPQRRFLRTGDLGFLHDGELFITGRMKDVIIVRGRKLYPQDVEDIVEREAPFVSANGCAAFPLEAHGEELLGLVFEGDRGAVLTAARAPQEIESLIAKIQTAIAREFDVRVSAMVLVRPGSFPRTSSGKVRRRACLTGLKEGTLQTVFSWRAPRSA